MGFEITKRIPQLDTLQMYSLKISTHQTFQLCYIICPKNHFGSENSDGNLSLDTLELLPKYLYSWNPYVDSEKTDRTPHLGTLQLFLKILFTECFSFWKALRQSHQ